MSPEEVYFGRIFLTAEQEKTISEYYRRMFPDIIARFVEIAFDEYTGEQVYPQITETGKETPYSVFFRRR
jgi:hypothetical protein